jgi:hypothetical protein
MNVPTLRERLEPALRRLFHLYWRFARGMTLGVRGVVLDRDNRVFLVKHSYVAGWHLPGGGVEVGESLRDALRRELVEEGRIELAGEAKLHGVFFNSHVSPRDHVAVRTGCPRPTMKSWRAGFSTPRRCRRGPPRAPGCGSGKCSRPRRRSQHGVELRLC